MTVAEPKQPHVYAYPGKTLATCFFFTVVAFATLGLLAFQAFQGLQTTWERDFEVRTLQGQVIYLDEVLTMSARMAAMSGDLTWEERYRRYEPQLDAAIKRTAHLVPSAYEIAAAKKTDESNVRLIAMENEAFARTKVGDFVGARTILLGETYAREKEVYAQGMREIDDVVVAKAEAIKESAQRRALYSLIVGSAILPILIYSWYLTVKTIRRWHREVTRLNHTLESRVENRTAEVVAANQRLKFEMAERHIAEEEREASKAALMVTSKMAALGEMAGGVAHEINTPLGVIVARARHVQKVLAAEPAKISTAVEFAKIIETTAETIAEIVRGLRAFSRSGEGDPFDVCHVRQVVNDTLALCAEKFRSHGVDLRIDDIRPDLALNGRGVQISQVLLNLLSNARDAVEEMEEKWVHVSVREDGDSIAIAVTDSGKGVPQAVRDKIMQPFFTTKAVGKGTGLGLSISKGIIEDHHGTLAIDKKSANTRFVVTLPKAGTRRRKLAKSA